MSFRGFIAVEVECGDALRNAIAELSSFGRELKPVSPENVHITLKFLGNTDEGDVPRIEDILKEAVADTHPFTVFLKGTGVFPNARNPRVVWVGMEGAEPMVRMAARIESGLESLGFRKEKRAFSPHLTLARVREGFRPDINAFLQSRKDEDFGELEVSAIKLKKSVLTPKGPIYSDVAVVRL